MCVYVCLCVIVCVFIPFHRTGFFRLQWCLGHIWAYGSTVLGCGYYTRYFSQVPWSPFFSVSNSHCVKSVRNRSYSGPYLEILRISPYSVRKRENTDQYNSKYGHFLRSVTSKYETPASRQTGKKIEWYADDIS